MTRTLFPKISSWKHGLLGGIWLRAAGQVCLMFVFCLGISHGWGGEPFHYPEGKSGKGELAYVNGLPLLQVRGTPEEMGTQIAELAVKHAGRAMEYPRDFVRQIHLEMAWPLLVAASSGILPNFPHDHRAELESIATTLKHGRDHLIAANTMFDIIRGLGCSTLIVESDRSATHAPIFGRNLDFPTLGYLHEFSLVTIYHPQGKRSFVSIGFPGCIGVLSGMNDAGLTLAVLEVYDSKEKSLKFDPRGTPYALCFRRLLEECATVDEAETLLRGMKRTTWMNLAICDRTRGVVFEITPRTIAVRPTEEGMVPCTNHFRTLELAQNTECWRYPRLDRAKSIAALSVNDVGSLLDQVDQGDLTLQTMIFEPSFLRLHLAIGTPPTSALPKHTIELGKLLSE